MRLFSTRNSFDNGEVSVLAIIETALAICSAIYIATTNKSSILIFSSCVIAPLLLLRTEQSTQMGLLVATKLLGRLDSVFTKLPDPSESTSPLVRTIKKYLYIASMFVIMFIYSTLTYIICTISKVIAVIYGITFYPKQSITAIPLNWFKYVFCIDTANPPEAIVGISNPHKYSIYPDFDGTKHLTIEGWFHSILTACKSRTDFILCSILFSPLLLSILIPSIIYRWSIKSTAVIFTPLLWIINTYGQNIINICDKMTTTRMSIISKIKTAYSALIIILLAIKIVFIYNATITVQHINSEILTTLYYNIFIPNEIPLWQSASIANSLITLALFFFSDIYLIKSKSSEPINTHKAETIFRTAATLRTILTLYITPCLGYVFFKSLSNIGIPPLKFILFPW